MKIASLFRRRGRGVLVACILSLLSGVSATAQDWDDLESRASLTIGPGFQGGASMILEPPELFKIKPTFSWKGEVHATYPITPTIATGLGIGYERRGTYMHVFNNEDIGEHLRIGYFTFHPHIVFSGFSLGAAFGFPLTDPPSFGGVGGGDIPVLVESRMEGIISLADLEDGWFSLIIGGGYSHTTLLDIDGSSDAFGNWNHVSAYMGLRFEFAIPDTERD